jgi:hypothetical protein
MPQIETPQFRTQLLRKLKNLFPKYEPEFIEELRQGIGFRLKDKKGQYRTEIVHIHRYHKDVLTKQSLLRVIKIK